MVNYKKRKCASHGTGKVSCSGATRILYVWAKNADKTRLPPFLFPHCWPWQILGEIFDHSSPLRKKTSGWSERLHGTGFGNHKRAVISIRIEILQILISF